jgi:hypothetical protein
MPAPRRIISDNGVYYEFDEDVTFSDNTGAKLKLPIVTSVPVAVPARGEGTLVYYDVNDVPYLYTSSGGWKTLEISSTEGVPNRITTVSGASYTVLNTDLIINVTGTSTTAVTINLPAISSLPENKVYHIKDAGLNAFTNNITIVPNGADTFEGEADAKIQTDGLCLSIYNGGSGWLVY